MIRDDDNPATDARAEDIKAAREERREERWQRRMDDAFGRVEDWRADR